MCYVGFVVFFLYFCCIRLRAYLYSFKERPEKRTKKVHKHLCLRV
nr:MAG TPA: CCSMST1 family protein [Caudoviricetes sp.]